MPYDPDASEWLLDEERYLRAMDVARRLRFYFRPVYEGFEHLRGDRGVMLVANHGPFSLEVLWMQLGAYEHANRPIRPLGDHVLFQARPVRRVLRANGSCEATPAVAHKLLSRGEICYVCPGGAREALASAEDRYKLFWDGHLGFVRSALRAGALIVPVATVGIEETFRHVLDAEEVRETTLGKLVVELFGAKYVPPIYAGLGPLPLPAQLHFLAGEPIDVPGGPDAAGDVALVRAVHARTKAALESLIARGRRAREEREAAMPPGVARTATELLRWAAG